MRTNPLVGILQAVRPLRRRNIRRGERIGRVDVCGSSRSGQAVHRPPIAFPPRTTQLITEHTRFTIRRLKRVQATRFNRRQQRDHRYQEGCFLARSASGRPHSPKYHWGPTAGQPLAYRYVGGGTGVSGSGPFQAARDLLLRQPPRASLADLESLIDENQQMTDPARQLIDFLCPKPPCFPCRDRRVWKDLHRGPDDCGGGSQRTPSRNHRR